MKKRPLALIIMDGFGLSDDLLGNAVAAARTPNLDRFFATCPNARLACSGPDVGLPEGQMGNSEVGHTNIGAGRIVYQELTNISGKIRDGSFFDTPELLSAVRNCAERGAPLHLIGLLSTEASTAISSICTASRAGEAPRPPTGLYPRPARRAGHSARIGAVF
jgi:2,3-bisphosphoglycerate-independent phosphoglycerate mutase